VSLGPNPKILRKLAVGDGRLYPDCWATFTGYPIIARWDLARDAGPLFEEALRVLALKAAVFELSGGDGEAAELIISPPVSAAVVTAIAGIRSLVETALRVRGRWLRTRASTMSRSNSPTG
jgi:hypothetical protein